MSGQPDVKVAPAPLMQRFYDALEAPEKRQRLQRGFLPAALEIEETPPSPVGRAIVWLIVALFAIGVVWASVGEIDIVAVAPGKVVPNDRVKVIQPLEIGVISAIHVRDGDVVHAGDALITLDATLTEADARRMRGELAVARLESARAAAFQHYIESGERAPELVATGETDASQRALHQQLLAEEIQTFQGALAAIDHELAQRRAEARGAAAEILKLEQTVPIITRRADALKRLLDRNLGAEATYLELEQQRIEAVQELEKQRAHKEEIDAAISALQERLKTARADALRQSLASSQESAHRVGVLEQEVIKAEQRDRQQVLLAPIDGVVTDLAVFTLGGVVTPAEKLLSLVPAESPLEIEAFVLNRDIGFVEEGQKAEVKIDTFNFTRYGVIDGTIVDVSNDAQSDESLGLVYRARVSLERSTIRVNDKLVNLAPGMAVTVEVKTGTRRIIEFFLSPLLRYRDESIRER